MALTPILSSFSSGEFSQRLDGRTDFEGYYSAARLLKNFVVQPHGGAMRRPGTRFIAACKDAVHMPVLVPFDFNASAGESYVLELGEGYIRFFWRCGAVLDGAAVYEVAAPWEWDELRDVRYSQIGDLMYLVHPNHAPRILTRLDHASWTLASVLFIDGPYRSVEADDTSIVLTPSGRTGSVTLAASSDLFVVTDVGRHVRLGYVVPDDAAAITWAWGTITVYTDARTVTVAVADDQAFGQEHMDDPSFEYGIAGWGDKSTSPSSISYDAVNKRLLLDHDASGSNARGEYYVEATPNVRLTLTVDVAVVNTQVRVYAGPSSGGTGYLGAQVITTTGQHSFDITPTQDDLYVTVDNSGSAAGDVDALDEVSLVRKDLSTSDWRLGAFGDGPGWPSALGFFEQRLLLFMGGQLYGSVPEQFETHTFHTPDEDDDAFSFRFSSPRVTEAMWAQDVENLLVGTNAGEFKLTTGADGDPISASKPLQPKRQSSHGSGRFPSIQAGNSNLYVSATGKKVRTLAYDAASYKYSSPEVSIFAEHLLARSPLVDLDYASEPDGVLWMVRADGVLLGATFLPEEKVNAWHRHELGGGGKVEGVAVIPGDGRSEVWLVVRREVGGAVVRYIEMLEENFDGTDRADAMLAFHVDCGLSTEGLVVSAATQASPVQLTVEGHGLATGDEIVVVDVLGMAELNSASFTVTVVDADTVTLDGSDGTGYARYDGGGQVFKKISTVTGLGHLEGETVDILADGAVDTSQAVSGGAVTLSRAAGVVHVGYGYESRLVPVRLALPTAGGTLQSKQKRVTAVSARLLHTVGGEIGAGEEPSSWETVYPYAAPVVGGAPPQLFTGDKRLTVDSSFATDAYVAVRQIYPLPMTVIALVPEIGDVA